MTSISPRFARTSRHAALTLAAALSLSGASLAHATDNPGAQKAIEQALTTASQDKKGITLYVAGQSIGGAVTKLEAGQWVELRNQQFGRIVVRIDRIDGIAMQ